MFKEWDGPDSSYDGIRYLMLVGLILVPTVSGLGLASMGSSLILYGSFNANNSAYRFSCCASSYAFRSESVTNSLDSSTVYI